MSKIKELQLSSDILSIKMTKEFDATLTAQSRLIASA